MSPRLADSVLITCVCSFFSSVKLQLQATSVGEVVIKGVCANRYLAMNRDGRLFGAVSGAFLLTKQDNWHFVEREPFFSIKSALFPQTSSMLKTLKAAVWLLYCGSVYRTLHRQHSSNKGTYLICTLASVSTYLKRVIWIWRNRVEGVQECATVKTVKDFLFVILVFV